MNDMNIALAGKSLGDMATTISVKCRSVWIVGSYTGGDGEEGWALEAICSTRDRAIKLIQPDQWFAGPLPIDEVYRPGEVVVFPGVTRYEEI